MNFYIIIKYEYEYIIIYYLCYVRNHVRVNDKYNGVTLCEEQKKKKWIELVEFR